MTKPAVKWCDKSVREASSVTVVLASVTSMNLKYYDGSGNRYEIDAAKLITFKPITPKQSSSGMYSGGQPWSRTLDDDEYTQLVALFDAAFADPMPSKRSRTTDGQWAG
jgi:hypothetical protein